MFYSFCWIAVFIISLLVLVKASDYFTDAAEIIGIYFGIPAFVIGATLITLGTTLPELFSSLFAVAAHSSEIVSGTALGSCIVNIFLVLGVAVLFSKEKVKITYDLLNVDLPLLIGAAFLLALTVIDGFFSWKEAALFLVFLIVYIIYNVSKGKTRRNKELGKEIKEEYKEEGGLSRKTFAIIFFGAVGIYFGAKYTIVSVVNLSEMLNIGKEVIAVTVIALGTSLPELMVSITAARKGKAELAVGNILGANMLNMLGVMGIAGIWGGLIIPSNIINFTVPVMLIATILYFFITQDKEITKWEGMLLIIFYILFVGKIMLIF